MLILENDCLYVTSSFNIYDFGAIAVSVVNLINCAQNSELLYQLL